MFVSVFVRVCVCEYIGMYVCARRGGGGGS